jgi:hypothetical protein
VSDGLTQEIPWDPEAVPHPLGRHIRHDVRSRAFAAPLGPEPTQDKRHRVYRKLNQGSLGCCVPTAGAGALNTAPTRSLVTPRPTIAMPTVHDWYRRVTRVDPFAGEWEPTDTGSSALALGEVLTDLGVINRYDWAFGFAHGLANISERPWLAGTWWTNDMFHPDADGRVHPTGGDAGGHEYEWVGVELRSRLTRGDNRAWFVQTWGLDYGVNGYFYMTWDDFAELVARDGDLVAFA